MIKGNNQKTNQDDSLSISGANLECFLSYKDMEIEDFLPIVNNLLGKGLTIKDKKAIFVFLNEEGANKEYLGNKYFGSFEKLIKFIQENGNHTAIVKFFAKAYDINIEINLEFYLASKVIGLTTTENFIWGFADALKFAKFERVDFFTKICKSICEIKKPNYYYIGTELLDEEDMSFEKASDNPNVSPYDENSFSSDLANNLLDWYVNNYGVKRSN